MKILHADDHPLFREGIRFFLKLLDGDVDIIEAGGFQALQDKLVLEAPIDLLLLDLDMPGMGELEGFFTIRRRYPELPVAILSGVSNTQVIRVLLDGGAQGFISKSASSEELLDALRRIMAGEIYTPKSLFSIRQGEVSGRADAGLLTPRQMDFLSLLADGMANKQIADALNVTEGTVKQHLKTIFKKLNVSNRTQAVQTARRLNLLSN